MNIIALEKGCYIGRNVQARQYENLTASETIYPEGYVSDWHYHQNPHYSHILQGGSQEIRGKASQIQFQGEGLYYYPGIPHQNTHYRADTRIFNLEVEQAFFDKYQLPVPSEACMFSENQQFNSAGLLKIIKEYYYQDEQSNLAITQLTLELIANTETPFKDPPDWTKKIRPLLYDSWDAPLSLQQMASQLEIHPVTLSKYFSKYYHCTIGEYRRRIKIEKAVPLIRQDKYSLTEIAYRCEFSDQAHFTRTFQRLTGLLPKHYKNL